MDDFLMISHLDEILEMHNMVLDVPKNLGNGFELIKFYDSGYYRLYHNDNLVTDKLFRIGGIGGKFVGDYCVLLYYDYNEELFVVINTRGEICLTQKDPNDGIELLGNTASHICAIMSGKTFILK
jgi:hypothetical protein